MLCSSCWHPQGSCCTSLSLCRRPATVLGQEVADNMRDCGIMWHPCAAFVGSVAGLQRESQAQPCLRGAAVWSFVHAMRSCPRLWHGHSVPACQGYESWTLEQLPDDVFLHPLFSPQRPCNTVSLLPAGWCVSVKPNVH